MNKNEDVYRFSRIMYIIEATLEYFISIAVSTVYLAKLTTYIGMSDSITGILSSFVSLGCGFQLIAVFLSNRRPVKRWVTILHMISQLLFAAIYIVPILNLSKTQRTLIFIILLLSAYIIHNMINSPKINWFMSLIQDQSRGKFTANKEIVSLISGIVFSYLLGFVIDHFEAKNNIKTAFLLCGIGLTILMLLHSMTLILSKEKICETEKISIRNNLHQLFKNKTLFKVILIPILWNIANSATISFSGTYQTKELVFSTSFASIIIMTGSLIRAVVSRPFGKLADKYSFRKMLSLCFFIEAIAFSINIFTTPKNGRVLFFVYYILHSVGMAGINSSTINLIFDYINYSQRTNALAIQQTVSGFAGFFITLALSPLVTTIQQNNNQLFGISIYAQQLLSIFSLFTVIIVLIYTNTIIKNLKRIK